MCYRSNLETLELLQQNIHEQGAGGAAPHCSHSQSPSVASLLWSSTSLQQSYLPFVWLGFFWRGKKKGELPHLSLLVAIGARSTFISLGSCCLAGRPWAESLSHPLQINRKSHNILQEQCLGGVFIQARLLIADNSCNCIRNMLLLDHNFILFPLLKWIFSTNLSKNRADGILFIKLKI